MSLVSRGFVWLIALGCGACSGEYWLGGVRGQDSGNPAEEDRKDGGEGEADGASEPGANELVLDADIVLTGDQSRALPESGTGGGCRVVGNGHQIRSEGTWLGRLSMRGCIVEGLGSA